MTTIKSFIERNKVRFAADWTDTNPNMAADNEWMRGANHWKVTFRCAGRTMTTYFSQGPAISREPSAEDVLDCLASDACGIDNAAGDFEQWASEYGYDTYSRKAERTFRACQKAAEKLERLLGYEAYQELLYKTERE